MQTSFLKYSGISTDVIETVVGKVEYMSGFSFTLSQIRTNQYIYLDYKNPLDKLSP